MPTPTEQLLTGSQVAERLALGSARTLETWRQAGTGPPFVKLGKLIRYKVSDLNNWIETRTVGAARAS